MGGSNTGMSRSPLENPRDVDLEASFDFRIESALWFIPGAQDAFCATRILSPDTPEENAWPVVDEAKDVAKWGGRSAACAAASDIARSDTPVDTPRIIRPAFPSRSAPALFVRVHPTL
jgi:hypothetical protein